MRGRRTRDPSSACSSIGCRCRPAPIRSEEHTSELQSLRHLVCIHLLPMTHLAPLSLHAALPICRILGMCICNDRRWPETYRVMGLQGVEMIVLGYNTPAVNARKADEGPEQRLFQHRLSLQAGAYQNSTWVVATAKAGTEDGHALIGGSCIVSPGGEIVAQAETEHDELVVADCDLDATAFGKSTVFDFARHRRIEHYGRIAGQTGVILPP